MRARPRLVKIISFVAVLPALACGKRDVTPTADPARKDPTIASASVSETASAAPGSVASARAPRGTNDDVPELVFKQIGESKGSQSLHPIEGGLMVAEERRVGRIVPETESIEWVGKIPTGNPALGGTYIRAIVGKWPEPVDVLYQNLQGRAAEPTYLPLLPKAPGLVTGVGGTPASIAGVVTINGSTILAYHEMLSGFVLRTMRGKPLPRKAQTIDQAGCKPDEVVKLEGFPVEPAVRAYAVGATEAGTLITIGSYCDKRGYASEIWDKDGKSRIVPLPGDRKSMGYPSRFLGLGGDELYYFGGHYPILHFVDGGWKELPARKPVAHDAFLSPDKKLHLVDDEGIHRLEDGAWKRVARFGWSAFWPVAFDGKNYWSEHAGAVGKLIAAPAGERLEISDACATPFVYISDVSSKNDDKFTFPTTRKALSTFPGIEELTLVQFADTGPRRLGLKVKTREQGDAVIAHLAKAMKEEKPRLVCFAPKTPREIAWSAK